MKKMMLGLLIGLAAGIGADRMLGAAFGSGEAAVVVGGSAASAALASSAGTPSSGLYTILDPDWARATLWDNGDAELNLYGARLNREFGLRENAYAATVIVKEAFTPKYLVKADDWRAPGNFDVLKLNHITYAQTGLYDWDQMISTFIERQRWVPVKMTYGHQEWCGNVFKEWRRWGNERSLFASSYFDGQGTQTLDLPLDDDVVPYDSLLLLLRALRLDAVTPAQEVRFPLYPSLRGSQVGPVEPVDATLTIGDRALVHLPLGDLEAVEVSLTYPTAGGESIRETYWIEASGPNRILKVEGPGEESLELQRSERLEYWRMSGDELPWFPAGVFKGE